MLTVAAEPIEVSPAEAVVYLKALITGIYSLYCVLINEMYTYYMPDL